MECIDVTITAVVHHAPGKFGRPGGIPYLIAKTACRKTVKGQMRTKPQKGEKFRLWGETRPQKPPYGDAFEFVEFSVQADRSLRGVESYLARHIYGIGPVKAKAILAAFGVDALDILRTDPERAAEADGIGDAEIISIRNHFNQIKGQDPAAQAALMDLFAGLKFPRNLPKKCVQAWGSDAAKVIRDNPYLLMDFPRMGWDRVDPFATSVVGYPENGLFRHQAALIEGMTRIAEDGHTVASMAEMMNSATRIMGMTLRDDVLVEAIRNGHVAEFDGEDESLYQPSILAMAEEDVAADIAALIAGGRGPIAGLVTPEWAAEHSLGSDQEAAARLVQDNPVAIVTGAPGTGKSFLVSRLMLRLKELGRSSIRCCAPTGKAAKRMAILLAEVGITDIPCTTVHRALDPSPPELEEEGVPKDDAKFGRGLQGWGFGRNANNPIEEHIIIVEEPSMLGAKLASSLFGAIRRGSRVIIVGDPHQLPSVDAGSFLRDVIGAGVPTATLTEIRRSDTCGTVVHACHAIINDREPAFAARFNPPSDNWIHIELDDPEEIAAKVVEINMALTKFDRVWETQVVSPQKAKLAFGCDRLNSMLSRALNPDSWDDNFLTGFGPDESMGSLDLNPRIGDKIVRTRNGMVDELTELEEDATRRADLVWDDRRWAASPCSVVNGDMGTVVDYAESDVIVRFRDPDRLCRLPSEDSHIILAYAMTVHKMQGSGSPCVILPVHNSFYFDDRTGRGLWNSELFYTAISRTEKLLITIGQRSASLTACGRRTVNRRRTTLESRLRSALAGDPRKTRDDSLDFEYAGEIDVD